MAPRVVSSSTRVVSSDPAFHSRTRIVASLRRCQPVQVQRVYSQPTPLAQAPLAVTPLYVLRWHAVNTPMSAARKLVPASGPRCRLPQAATHSKSAQ